GPHVTVTTVDSTITCKSVDGEYPRWRSLVPAEDATPVEVGAIGVGPRLIARFDKVAEQDHRPRRGDTVPPLRIKFGGARKPIDIRFGTTFRAIVMPAKLVD